MHPLNECMTIITQTVYEPPKCYCGGTRWVKIDTSDGLLHGVAELLRQFYPQTWCQTSTAQQIKLIKRRRRRRWGAEGNTHIVSSLCVLESVCVMFLLFGWNHSYIISYIYNNNSYRTHPLALTWLGFVERAKRDGVYSNRGRSGPLLCPRRARGQLPHISLNVCVCVCVLSLFRATPVNTAYTCSRSGNTHTDTAYSFVIYVLLLLLRLLHWSSSLGLRSLRAAALPGCRRWKNAGICPL